jgi:hypothetical protein
MTHTHSVEREKNKETQCKEGGRERERGREMKTQ